MTQAEKKASELLFENFTEKKIMNVAELTTKFSVKELTILGGVGIGTIQDINKANEDGKILDFFPNMFMVIAYVSFLVTQVQLIDNALTEIKKANTFYIKTIDSEIPYKCELFLN